MKYVLRWQSADGTLGAPIGHFDHHHEAQAALLKEVQAAADELEHGTGTAGEWTPDGALYRGDWDILLGRYVIEQGEG